MANREFDIIVFGASSFVGKIVCNYLVNEHTEPNLNWAMAGRSEIKLRELKTELGNRSHKIPVIIADSREEASLRSMCKRTEVVISTVGPYALYGELLVKACAVSGTDYCDLTGEPQWIKTMIERYQPQAQASGARIVHCCGFDSIPSDLGVKYLQQLAQQEFGSYCEKIKMRVKASKGGASGGTVASGLNLYKEMAQNPALRQQMKDLNSLCPEDTVNLVRQHEVSVEYDEDFQSWVGPFVMAGINTRVVLRSNALRPEPYATEFRYDEGTLTGAGRAGEKRAKRLARGIGFVTRALALAPVRALASRFFLPKPGEGPTPKQQRQGFYDLRFIGSTARGEQIGIKVTGDRDPGYGSTAKMLAQAGISLRRDVDKGAIGGGFWTPALVFDEKTINRLRSFAGVKFERIEFPASLINDK